MLINSSDNKHNIDSILVLKIDKGSFHVFDMPY